MYYPSLQESKGSQLIVLPNKPLFWLRDSGNPFILQLTQAGYQRQQTFVQ